MRVASRRARTMPNAYLLIFFFVRALGLYDARRILFLIAKNRTIFQQAKREEHVAVGTSPL